MGSYRTYRKRGKKSKRKKIRNYTFYLLKRNTARR